MYEQHFGLKKRPFPANATASDVFVGPQIATAMASLKKAFGTDDAIATVSGPVGSGKTTLVLKALESLGANAKVIMIGRIRMQSSDVLEFLLDELNVEAQRGGAIQKFSSFRRHLQDLADNGCRVYIAVEDSVRLGADTLAEIEALTAADAGVSDGANVVLMSDEQLGDLLADPGFDRIRQRIRQRIQTLPLCDAEMRGYLRHCFRLAGGDFESSFESNAAQLLAHLSTGLPRVANNLVDAAMRAAADQGESTVSSQLLTTIAERDYGLSAAGFEVEPIPPVERRVQAPVVEDLPELIQDTLPDLEVLAPDLTTKPVETPPQSTPEPASLPTLKSNDIPAPEVADTDVPAWDRDPTMAELKPDLDALEQAMAFAQPDAPEIDSAENPAADQSTETPAADAIPEITLDHAISQRVDDKLIDEPGEISAPEPPELAVAEKPAMKSDVELDKITSELAKAKSIEDVDDKMAETLFGGELSLAASQLIAKPEIAAPANENSIDVAVAVEQPAAVETSGDENLTLEVRPEPDAGSMDLSASQRLKTVRALNADLHPSLREPETPAANDSPADVAQGPESIEDQINTSMTHTLEALSLRPSDTEIDNDDDEDASKSGFFGRFKRS